MIFYSETVKSIKITIDLFLNNKINMLIRVSKYL